MFIYWGTLHTKDVQTESTKRGKTERERGWPNMIWLVKPAQYSLYSHRERYRPERKKVSRILRVRVDILVIFKVSIRINTLK